jgi:C4-dicarboxylate-specific signal transduction histidine kinase
MLDGLGGPITQSYLREGLRFETLLSQLSARLIHASIADIDTALERGLGTVVQALGGDRGALVELSPDGTVRHAWTTHEETRVDEVEWTTTLPLEVGGTTIGRLMLGPTHAEHAWDLKLLGEIFASALARRQGEEEMQRLRQDLAHIGRVSAMGELTASLAHELNQPLTAILNNAQVAQRLLAAEVVDVGEMREILSDIIADDKRAADVIRRLRLLLRKGDLQYLSLDVNEIVTDVARLVASDAAIRSVTIRVECADGLPRVRGDRGQLQQVVLNLVLNGLDAMRASGRNGRRLVIRTFRKSDALVGIAVRDAGSGISEHDAQHMFEPLYTTKPEGLGMGLAIARTIVGAHGGRLSAENNADGGTTFQFTLPVYGADAA